MAQFQPSKKLIWDFNDGEKYNDGDGLQAKTINDLVESTLYAQDHTSEGAGHKLYRHCISIASGDMWFEIYDTHEQPYTNATLYTNHLNETFPCTGAKLGASSSNIDGTVYVASTVTLEDLSGKLQFNIATVQQTYRNGTLLIKNDNAYTNTSECADTVYILPVGGSGGAPLTNYDGDSMEEGFTQYYIKRGAQAKNYYNLGMYDTYESNGDGTATITRQTGYITAKDMEWAINSDYPYANGTIWTPLLASAKDIGDFFTNKGNIQFYSLQNHETQGWRISFGVGRIGLTFNDQQELNKFMETLVIQFKLASPYTERVIDNEPIHTLNGDGEKWVRNEWQKTLNLFDAQLLVKAAYLGAADGVESASTKDLCTDFLTPSSTVYTLTVGNVAEQLSYIRISFYDKHKNYLSFANFNITNPQPIALPLNCGLVRLVVSSKTTPFTIADVEKCNIMLVGSSTPYPYTPYNGDIVHKKELVLYSHTINIVVAEKGDVGTRYNNYFYYINLLSNEKIDTTKKFKTLLKLLGYTAEARPHGLYQYHRLAVLIPALSGDVSAALFWLDENDNLQINLPQDVGTATVFISSMVDTVMPISL